MKIWIIYIKRGLVDDMKFRQMVEKKKFWLNGKLLQEDAYFIEFKKNLAKQSEEVSPSRYGAISNSAPQNQNFQPQSVAGDRVKGKGGFASLKLGIFDSIVEVSLKGTIRLKEAELPRLIGVSEHLAVCEKKFPLWKRNPRFGKKLFEEIWRKIVNNSLIFHPILIP